MKFLIGKKSILVPIFSRNFHFGSKLFFSLFLVPILKNASHFCLYRYIRDETYTASRRLKLRTLNLKIIDPQTQTQTLQHIFLVNQTQKQQTQTQTQTQTSVRYGYKELTIMDFFKSFFSEDSEQPQNDDAPEPNLDPNPDPDSDSTMIWSFNGLIKTIASKSESVI